ncbi:MAG: hypothetical protein KKB79_02755 [Nanoarchaeota archaeon]|nr:hypothetical protein [Nanoarchaeota archaeon]
MLGSMVNFQFGGFYGGDFGSFLSYLENAGFFSYILPFLLIFAVVFGILTKIDLFKHNKTVNVVISLAVGLLSLQFSFVPLFFSEIFPRLGIGLAIILVGMILVGIFLPSDKDNKYVGWFGLVLGLLIFVVVIVQSFEWTGGSWGWWFYENWAKIFVPVVVVGFVIAIIKNSAENHGKIDLPPYGPPVYRTP